MPVVSRKHLKRVFKKEVFSPFSFEEKKNILGFFDLLLKIARRNPDLWEEICKNSSKNSEKNSEK